MATKDKEIRNILDEIIQGKINSNRRYVDQILEKIQDQNRKYYLEKMIIEVQRMELEEKAGNRNWAEHHKIMAEAYKGILEKAFGLTG